MLISRRKLLRMTGSVAAAMAALPLTNLTHLFAHKIDLEIEVEPEPEAPPAPLGRVANWQVQIRAAPKVSAKVVRVAKRDEVLRLYEQVAGDAEAGWTVTVPEEIDVTGLSAAGLARLNMPATAVVWFRVNKREWQT